MSGSRKSQDDKVQESGHGMDDEKRRERPPGVGGEIEVRAVIRTKKAICLRLDSSSLWLGGGQQTCSVSYTDAATVIGGAVAKNTEMDTLIRRKRYAGDDGTAEGRKQKQNKGYQQNDG